MAIRYHNVDHIPQKLMLDVLNVIVYSYIILVVEDPRARVGFLAQPGSAPTGN